MILALTIILYLTSSISYVQAEFTDTPPYDEVDQALIADSLTENITDATTGEKLDTFIPDATGTIPTLDFTLPTIGTWMAPLSISIETKPTPGSALDNIRIVGRLFMLLSFTFFIIGSIWRVIRQY